MTLRLTQTQARGLAVAAQRLDRRPRRKATRQDVLDAIRRMGVLQIDTIHVVARSPYLVLWSRLGDYESRWLDELLAEGAIFEYWAHEACFLPIEDYGLLRHRMIDPGLLGWKYSHDWVTKHRDQVQRVLAAIRERGPLRSADFERRNGKGGGWWGWKPEKRALEMLFSAGELMVARRENFQRVYDLRERVHARWSDALMPSLEHANRTLVLQAVAALGIVTARRVPDYYRMSARETVRLTTELARAGELLQVTVAGWKEPGYVHPSNRELAERAAADELRFAHTTFLSPFDPLVWDRARALEMFGFEYRLECYTPAPQRRFGYFALPILRRGRLVGRMDAKARRADGVFEVRRIALDEGVRPGPAMAADVARALFDLARWHQTPELAVLRAEPRSFGPLLRRAITNVTGAPPLGAAARKRGSRLR
jgi:uncharacterized protein YcaQ